jgi:hypothetical protein
MHHRTREERPAASGGGARRARSAAAAIALALAACGAGGGEETARETNQALGRAAAGSENGAAAHAGGGAVGGTANDGGAAIDGAASVGGVGIDGAADRPEGAIPGPAGSIPTAGANGARASGRRAAAPPLATPAPPDPSDPIPDAPPPPIPERPELTPEAAIARAAAPPVGREVRSLATCGDVARAYDGLMERNRSCRRDEDCRVIEGACAIGLGGCWYAVHRSVTLDDADRLAARYRDLACGGPVCRCAPPPERAWCDQGVCTDDAPSARG